MMRRLGRLARRPPLPRRPQLPHRDAGEGRRPPRAPGRPRLGDVALRRRLHGLRHGRPRRRGVLRPRRREAARPAPLRHAGEARRRASRSSPGTARAPRRPTPTAGTARSASTRRRSPTTTSRYSQPQETGNKVEVRWAALTNAAGAGLLAVGQPLLGVNALHHAAEDMDQAGHHHQMPPRAETYLNLDGKQMGLGGDDSWGALPLEKYRIKAGADVLPLPPAADRPRRLADGPQQGGHAVGPGRRPGHPGPCPLEGGRPFGCPESGDPARPDGPGPSALRARPDVASGRHWAVRPIRRAASRRLS